MFEKFHWGHGITIFYIFFVGMAATVLISSFGIDHALVEDDYYAKDIAYQDTYEKMSNNIADDNLTIDYDQSKKVITLEFAKEPKLSGEIFFYRPSDQSKDFSVAIKNSTQEISTDGMIPGKWKIKIDWKENAKSYYKEETLHI